MASQSYRFFARTEAPPPFRLEVSCEGYEGRLDDAAGGGRHIEDQAGASPCMRKTPSRRVWTFPGVFVPSLSWQTVVIFGRTMTTNFRNVPMHCKPHRSTAVDALKIGAAP